MQLRQWRDSAASILLLVGCGLVYGYTAAPSVLSGDSAEFQFAAPLGGVPHPTTYPLYVMLSNIATRLLPFGDFAHRVTLVSSGAAALAVALCYVLIRRIGYSWQAALMSAFALAVTPGLWNSATLAEVYALLITLLVGLGLLLLPARPTYTTPSALFPPWSRARMMGASLVAGLGCTHHGLFIIIGMPLFVVVIGIWIAHQRPPMRSVLLIVLCFAFGLTPWFYPIAQYARYGPFNNQDYGLPQHYFWGAPTSWSAMLDLLNGGVMRRGVFRLPSTTTEIGAVCQLIGDRLRFEFGVLGLSFGLLGSVLMARSRPTIWLGTLWVLFVTTTYLLLLGPAVADAPIFTLPILLPWVIWIAAASDTIAAHAQQPAVRTFLLLLLFSLTLAWGFTRLPYTNKRHLWLFRTFGETTLAHLPPNAVILTHWEQGTTLQYLILVEHRRPDVWIDIVEPGDEAWEARSRRRYRDRPVFFVGRVSDLPGVPVEQIRADDYADLFRWRGP